MDKLAHPPKLKKVDALDAYPPYVLQQAPERLMKAEAENRRFRNGVEKLEEKKKELLATSH